MPPFAWLCLAVFTHVPNLTISMNNSGINGHAAVLQNVVSKINRGHALSLLAPH